ncbi:hypothetical protein N9T48_00260 [bacterium]|nr:hypothetical protein [bacterium]
MDQQNENIEFKSTREYLKHWDIFFEEWSKGESHQKKLLENDKIWSKHKGTEWETKKGEKKSTKLEPDAFPQPYLGNIDDHSVITLNLNPSRSKKYGYENFKEPVLDSRYKYNQYAESFPTYDTHPFWQKQDDWIDSLFKEILVEEILVEEKLYQYNPETKKKEKLKPFAIEICPWGSKSWLGLGIKKESKKLKNLNISTIFFLKYLNNLVFDVIEKAIDNSKLKIILSVGKAYYDIFDHKESGFCKIIECTKSRNSKAWDLKLDKDDEIKVELNKAFFEKVWPKKKENNENLRYVNRSFSFWKKNGVIYFNSWSPGSNKPPGKEFDKIEQEFFRIYKSLIK